MTPNPFIAQISLPAHVPEPIFGVFKQTLQVPCPYFGTLLYPCFDRGECMGHRGDIIVYRLENTRRNEVSPCHQHQLRFDAR